MSQDETFKIKHAEAFFGGEVKIKFKTQFSNHKILDLIRDILKEDEVEDIEN